MPDEKVAAALHDGWPEYGEGYWERGEGSNYVRYADDPGWMPTARVLWQMKPGPRLLEVGCSKGYFVRAARLTGFDAQGLDVSRYALAHPAPGVGHLLQYGSVTEIPWPTHSFDVVCSWEMLEHVPKDRLDVALTQMATVATPGSLQVHRIGTLEPGTDLSDHLSDETHVTNEPGTWWRDLMASHFGARREDVERVLDAQFTGRDWAGRFFAYETV